MKVQATTKKTFVRFFTWPRLFADGYEVVEGNGMPRIVNIPDLEVPGRKMAELDFLIPNHALGFMFYETITARTTSKGKTLELSSGEINHSGRYFFQKGKDGRLYSWCDYGRVVKREEAQEVYGRHNYMRLYSHSPVPERIILYTGEHYYKHGYSVSRAGRYHTRESAHHICTFDFLETDIVVPIFFVFHLQDDMIRAAEDKKGWIMPHQRVA